MAWVCVFLDKDYLLFQKIQKELHIMSHSWNWVMLKDPPSLKAHFYERKHVLKKKMSSPTPFKSQCDPDAHSEH